MNRLFLRLGWLTLLPLFLALGCQSNEDVTSYKAPKSTPPPQLAPPEEVRLLGAIFPRGEECWFFKFLAPVEAVAAHEKEFQQLIKSVKFDDKVSTPTWKTPEGWKQGPATQFLTATLNFGPADEPLQVGISHAGGSLLDNVNRWRGQIRLQRVDSEKDLRTRKLIRDEAIGDLKYVLVDMIGLPSPKGARPAMGERPHAAPRISYTPPAGWKEIPPANRFAHTTFRLPDSASETPEVTVSSAGGALLDNINLWRSQVGLNEVDKEPTDLKKITVADKESVYVDLTGPAGPGQKRMLVVVVKNGDVTWFFKLQAPPEIVSKHQTAFEAFVKSVRFEAGPGAKP